LHVLSAPPAFVLSQDQTLREEGWPDKSDQSFVTLSLCSKSHPEGWRQGLFSTRSRAIWPRRKRTLLSFQGPSLLGRRKKGPDSRQRPQDLRGFLLRGNLLRHSVFARLQGLSYSALSGSRGSVARSKRESSGFVEPNEAPLAGLEHGARQPLPRNVELAHRIAVELHAALCDQPTPLAPRQAERIGEERR
jgi:hypothetical protein